MDAAATLIETHRRYLTAIAYRILGSVHEAEDAVQEGYLRLQSQGATTLENPQAWLTRIVSRIALDMLGSARSRREQYVGPWLPEPLTDDHQDPARAAELADSVRVAVLLVMEQLSPPERVAFVLREVFDVDYVEIAATLDRSESATRKLVSRARDRITSGAPPRNVLSAHESAQVLAAFAAASAQGRIEELLPLLDESIVVRSDGGGIAPAARKIVIGPERVATLLLGLGTLYGEAAMVPVTGFGRVGTAVVADGAVRGFIDTEVVDGKLAEVNIITNPQKLGAIVRALGLQTE